ncbi:MAG TPA: sugar phosphate isomerase/epimerase family protein [Spirochaetia bacterium]|nr:sugar phosphate isomerase/epimerase family protein [Spirochaetia bacterium]
MAAPKIAFNTANLVARVTGYHFEMRAWADQHEKTAASTTESEWAAICAEVAAAGYAAVEVWLAHCDPRFTDERRARALRRILDDHGLVPIGLAGALTEASARVCQWMEMPAANGGLWGTTLADVKRVVAATGLRFNFENHPERTPREIADRIEGGSPGVGLCVDTGWLGTQGMDAAAAIRSLGPLVRHVHLKDVRAPGTHETCPLGEGCVGIPAVVATLREMGYTGWYSWEDEPEARNPMLIAREMRGLIAELLG